MKRSQPQNHRVVPGTKRARKLMAGHVAANVMAPLHDLVRRAGESKEQQAARLEREAHNAEVEYKRQLKLAKKRVGPEVAAQLEGMVSQAVDRVLDQVHEGGMPRPLSKPPG